MRALILQAAACYRYTLEELHMRAYAASLARFDLEVVRAALSEAQRLYPDRFPMAPQLTAIATTLAKSRGHGGRCLALEAHDHLKGRLPASNPYEQLARKWERNPPRKAEGEQWLKRQTGS